MIWYPYEQMKTMDDPIKIKGAHGVYLETEDGPVIDTISSWWCMIHGYNHPVLNEAIKSQVDTFSHIMLGGLVHDPALKLSEKLASWLPGDLNYTFFSDSGSVGVEVAVKMALQYSINRNTGRRKILALENSYHGDTFKAMEIGDDSDYHFILSKKKDVIHIPTEISALESVFAGYGDELAAMIVEPLLQGAGGMLMYSVDFLKRARELCNRYDVVLIFDEVATGFGRTGYRFVSDAVEPDIIVIGKGMTGGYIGHAATVANSRVFNAFYSDNPDHALMHGPTFMGNPLACRAALASIELFEKENYMAKIARIEKITRREMAGFTDDRIKDIRIMGGCMCIEVKDPAVLKGFRAFALKRGVFNRPFLNYMYTMVPYIITEEELVKVYRVFKDWFRQ